MALTILAPLQKKDVYENQNCLARQPNDDDKLQINLI